MFFVYLQKNYIHIWNKYQKQIFLTSCPHSIKLLCAKQIFWRIQLFSKNSISISPTISHLSNLSTICQLSLTKNLIMFTRKKVSCNYWSNQPLVSLLMKFTFTIGIIWNIFHVISSYLFVQTLYIFIHVDHFVIVSLTLPKYFWNVNKQKLLLVVDYMTWQLFIIATDKYS